MLRKYLISFALPTFIVETMDVTVTNISAGNKPNDMKVTVPVGEHYQITGVKSWEIKNGENYAVVSSETGMSTATISRVNRCLEYGDGGYKTVLQRINCEEKK